jgi:DNA polymerase-3 subunit alpha
VRAQRMQSGRMMIIDLGDGTGRQEVSVYPEVFEKYRDILKEDAVVVMEVKVRLVRRGADDDGDSSFLRINAEKILDLAAARTRFARSVRLSVNGEASSAGAAAAQKLKNLLAPNRNGACPDAIHYRNAAASVDMRLGDDWRVSLDDHLLASLSEWLRPENVEVIYAWRDSWSSTGRCSTP